MMRAVTAMRGIRSMNVMGTTAYRCPRFGPRRGVSGDRLWRAAATSAALTLALQAGDLIEQGAVLAAVCRPDLLLRDLAERFDIALYHRHALGFEQLLGAFDVIDRLDGIAHFVLRLATDIGEKLLVPIRKSSPGVEVHHHASRTVVVVGE